MSPELQAALTAFLVALTLVIQSWIQRMNDRADKREVKKEVADKTAEVKAQVGKVEEKAETVHKAINGDGLTGKIDKLVAWAEAHERADNERYDGLLAKILALKSADVAPKR